MSEQKEGLAKVTWDDPETGEEIYRITNRGGKGVRTLYVTEKTGKLIAIKSVTDKDDLMIITKNGITIRYGFPRQQELAEAVGISRDTVSFPVI